ncbi:DUF2637 domain-containing protein [Streptomyces sp. NPDC127068]|uniref:DUF2637 domain-containing protein n=1 Tax=Streptomyces sp. NPDC127068 TaxID=3347127 RepID=UPI003648464F
MSHAHIAATAEPQSGFNLRGMTAWDRSAIVLLGAAGFAFSYDALRQIAIAIHAQESLSYLFPVFIDGFIAYGVRAIVLLRHRPFGARLYAWFLFLAATGASLGANALHAVTLNRGPRSGQSALHLSDSVVGVLSTLAPLALAGSVHLYILMARTAELSVRDGDSSGPGPVRTNVLPGDTTLVGPDARPLDVTVESAPHSIAAGPSPADCAIGTAVDLRKHQTAQCGEPPADGSGARSSQGADHPGVEPDQTDGLPPWVEDHGAVTPGSAMAGTSVLETAHTRPDCEESPVPDDTDVPQDREADDEWLEELLPIARAASEQAGRISREAVKEAVRAQQPISNDRLGVLLARLKEEEDATAKAPAGSSSVLW